MPSFLVAVATVMLAAARMAHAGNAIIKNKCNHPVYLWHISSDRADTTPTTIAAGTGIYSEPFENCKWGGVSLKLSNFTNLAHITQFEYTLSPQMIWYDISNVNCDTVNCPFQKDGLTLETGYGCANVVCKAGALTCHDAYTVWDDNWASHGCTTATDLTLTLCPGGSGGSGYIGGTTAAPDVAPAAAAAVAAPPPPPPPVVTDLPVKLVAAAAGPVMETPTKPTPTPTPQKPKDQPAPQPPANQNEKPHVHWTTVEEIVYVHKTEYVTVPPHNKRSHVQNAAQHPHARRHHHAHS